PQHSHAMEARDWNPMIAFSEFLQPRLSFHGADRFLCRKAILDALQEQLPNFTGRLLDVGCGQKPYRQLLLEPPSRVTEYLGLDLHNSRYAQFEQPDLEWDGLLMPLEADSIDCAIATEVLEQCPEPELLLSEVIRVLKPGGRFFFTIPFFWPVHDEPYDQYRFTPFALARHLQKAGFIQVEMK